MMCAFGPTVVRGITAPKIPEAPAGGTLYRTIFLAALALFVLTFVVNTAAELVRQRLRRKYSSL